MFSFHYKYLLLTVILFATEVMIGTYLHDAIIRPYGGDFLAVILIYCFVKSFLNTRLLPTVVCVLLLAYVVEISQYFHLINIVGLQNSKAARVIMGTSFSWTDMLMYTLGMIIVWIFEMLFNNKLKTI
jgi:hypothetical protein